MIRVYLCGGLGNQLFQYAFGRALSLRTKIPLCLDAASLFKRDYLYKRRYELEAFSLPGEVEVFHSPEPFHRIRRRYLKSINARKPLSEKNFVVEEKPYYFEQELMSWHPAHEVRVMGYWQCEQYFIDARERLKEDLRYTKPMSADAKYWKQRIEAAPNSVAVHARRVQYTASLPENYQQQAIEDMLRNRPGANIFLFSDDQKWAEDFAEAYDDMTFVRLKTPNSLEEFELMRACHHFIIANSSFSWWAAWLGERVDSVIIAPEVSIWNHPYTISQRWKTCTLEDAI